MTEDKKNVGTKTIPTSVIDWLAGQSFNNVLLAAILAAIGAGLYYGGPAFLKQIQTGYETLDTRHREERKQDREQYAEWLDRYDKRGNVNGAFADIPK